MAGGMQRRSAVLLLRLSAPLCLLAGLRHNYDVEGTSSTYNTDCTCMYTRHLDTHESS